MLDAFPDAPIEIEATMTTISHHPRTGAGTTVPVGGRIFDTLALHHVEHERLLAQLRTTPRRRRPRRPAPSA